MWNPRIMASNQPAKKQRLISSELISFLHPLCPPWDLPCQASTFTYFPANILQFSFSICARNNVIPTTSMSIPTTSCTLGALILVEAAGSGRMEQTLFPPSWLYPNWCPGTEDPKEGKRPQQSPGGRSAALFDVILMWQAVTLRGEVT